MFAKSTSRFTLLLLEEGEDYIQDYSAFFCAASVVWHEALEISQMLPKVALGQSGRAVIRDGARVRGKLRLCTKSIFFDSEDFSFPILRFPLNKMDGCEGKPSKELCVKTSFFTACKLNNCDWPYVHKVLDAPTDITIQLEFASIESLTMHLMPVLNISKIGSIVEREAALQVFAREQGSSMKFDYRRLTDGFGEKVLKECRVRHLRPLVKEPGILLVTEKGLYFQPLHNITGSAVVKFQPAQAITAIARRKSAMRPLAIEIFMAEPPADLFRSHQRWGASSAMFQFADEATRDEVAKLLINLPDLGAAVKGSSALQRGALLEGKGAWLLHVQSAWIAGKITNLDYLLYLNFAAGRSFNVLSQWPVFPWLLADYTSAALDLSKPETFRDLSKPMGALGHAQRLMEARERLRETSTFYNPDDPNSDPGYMYGSHYSTPGYVMYWLVRRTPEQMLRLQNGRFDAPDRLFFSVAESWRSCTGRSNTDLKELIPEFFMPGDGDFLLNRKNLPLGRRQNGQLVTDVVLPPWAADAAGFIWKHRQALESEHTQRHLHLWIDLIFGCKQTGQAAVDADNVFRHTSYHGAVNLDSIQDPVMRAAKEAMISEFGQTPQRLFDENQPHPPRSSIQPMPTEPLPGYCGTASDGQEVSQALVHILLAVAAQEPLQTVLATPSFSRHSRSASVMSAAERLERVRRISAGTDERRRPSDSGAALAPSDGSEGTEASAFPRHPEPFFGSPTSRMYSSSTSGMRSGHATSSPYSGSPKRAAAAHGLSPVAPGKPGSPGPPLAPSSTPDRPMSPARLPSSPVHAYKGSSLAGAGVPQRQGSWASVPSLTGSAGQPADALGEPEAAVQPAALWPRGLHKKIKCAKTIPMLREDVTSLCCTGQVIVSGTSAGFLRTFQHPHAVAGHTEHILRLPRAAPVAAIEVVPAAHAPDSFCSVLAALYSRVYAFGLRGGGSMGHFQAHDDVVTSMSLGVGPHGGLLYTGSYDTTIKSWHIGPEVAPWQNAALPVLEMDSPDGSVPLCLRAQADDSQLLVGTDHGCCVLYDLRTGQPEWTCYMSDSIVDLAVIPADNLRATVVAHADNALSLVDLRRQESAAVLATVSHTSPITAVRTDGRCAVAGTSSGELLVWNLDPASDSQLGDGETGKLVSGAGMLMTCSSAVATDAVKCLAVTDELDGEWCLAVGRAGRGLDLCTFEHGTDRC